MYNLKDISIIIPTYNRSEDLETTIESFIKIVPEINELIVIDQSSDGKTKKMVKSLKNKKIKYFYSNIPSLTLARNLGVQKSSKKSKIITFLDDDVTLDKNYFNEVLKVFNDSAALGVGGYYLPKEVKFSKIENLLRRLFFIEHLEKDSARVLSVYGKTYPSKLSKVINSSWIPGFNMSFRKEVFKEFKFDQKLSRYALAEDFDFTYRIQKKYRNSLFITPHAKLVHRVSLAERYPTEKVAYMNQAHHFYLNFKNFNSSFKEKIIFFWTLFGIALLRTMQFSIDRKKSSALKMKYFFKSLWHCIKNLNMIKRDNMAGLVQ